MAEEQRHGWQMAYLLMTYFGQQGRREAQKLLERNAQDGDRLLGAFNRPMPHWLDFFNYTMFVDRDGKFQLGMLSTSAFIKSPNPLFSGEKNCAIIAVEACALWAVPNASFK